MGTSIRSYATAFASSKNCNIGYTNASTGKSLGYKNNLAVNQALAIHSVIDTTNAFPEGEGGREADG